MLAPILASSSAHKKCKRENLTVLANGTSAYYYRLQKLNTEKHKVTERIVNSTKPKLLISIFRQ